MVRNMISEFVKHFLPEVGEEELPNGMKRRFTPHSLLYDFNRKYSHQFTTKELQTCIQGYLALIDPVVEELDNLEESNPLPHKAASLYGFGHDNASELLLAYFQRTPKDEDYSALLDYIVAVDAIGQVERLLAFVDPDNQAVGMDSRERIASVLNILQNLVAKR